MLQRGFVIYFDDGESYQINALELHKTYVITLESTDSVFIEGENSITYDVYPRITATDFAIKDIVDNTVTLTWTCGEVVPDSWSITCDKGDGNPVSLETSGTSIDVRIEDFTKSYTFSLSALGMDKPEQLILDANPIIVSNLSAAPDENGNLVVTWDTPSGEPDGQWLISYRLKDGYYDDDHAVPSVSCNAADANSVTLKYLPANAQYEITLLALDTNTNTYPRIFGTTLVEVTTSGVIPFDEYLVWPEAPYGDGYDASGQIALWVKPDLETWNWSDLPADGRRTAFSTNDQIAMCIEVDSCDMSESVVNDTVYVTYVVRKASHGGVILVDGREMIWDSVWSERRHTGIVPMPMMLNEDGSGSVQTGQFLIEVYINGKLLASKGFTIDA